MKRITFTPESLHDLEEIKAQLDSEYGNDIEQKILKSILNDISRLERFPETDVKLFERFDIKTDYKCIYSNKNYIFYRLEDKYIRIIRILNARRDFLYILFGIQMTSEESEKYWDDQDWK